VNIALRDNGIDAVVHAGALHKPHVATHEPSRFNAGQGIDSVEAMAHEIFGRG
jgi:hypothetical protein